MVEEKRNDDTFPKGKIPNADAFVQRATQLMWEIYKSGYEEAIASCARTYNEALQAAMPAPKTEERSLRERIIELLSGTAYRFGLLEIVQELRDFESEDVLDALRLLKERGLVEKAEDGWTLKKVFAFEGETRRAPARKPSPTEAETFRRRVSGPVAPSKTNDWGAK